jgi:hypothetical protein
MNQPPNILPPGTIALLIRLIGRHESFAKPLQKTEGYAGLPKNLISGLGQSHAPLVGALRGGGN